MNFFRQYFTPFIASFQTSPIVLYYFLRFINVFDYSFIFLFSLKNMLAANFPKFSFLKFYNFLKVHYLDNAGIYLRINKLFLYLQASSIFPLTFFCCKFYGCFKNHFSFSCQFIIYWQLFHILMKKH